MDEQLIGTASVAGLRLDKADPEQPEAMWCLEQYYRELAARFEQGFSVERSLEADPTVFRPPQGAFLLGRIDGRPVACGALKFMDERVGYIKRMWVDPSVRGTGLGRRLLEALEALAEEAGCEWVQLETNRTLEEAQALYRRAGYEATAHHWFRKPLRRG